MFPRVLWRYPHRGFTDNPCTHDSTLCAVASELVELQAEHANVMNGAEQHTAEAAHQTAKIAQHSVESEAAPERAPKRQRTTTASASSSDRQPSTRARSKQ